MADNTKFLFPHLFNLIMVPHLAREVVARDLKREIEATDVVGSGRRGVWDLLLKACEELLRPDAFEAWLVWVISRSVRPKGLAELPDQVQGN